MKNKNIIIIVGAIIVIGILAVIGIGMFGKNDSATSQDGILPEKEETIPWVVLAELDTYQETLRIPMEEALNIKVNSETGEKIGQFYMNVEQESVQNNTLKGVMQNQLAKQKFKHDVVIEAFSNAALGTYTDLEADDTMTNFYMALNGYFNLLPDSEPAYANPNSTLSRAEIMALIMRADTPVDENLTVNKDFESVVGKSEYNLYAQMLDGEAYLSTTDSSLNDKTYTGTMSRAEYIYLLVNHYYAEWFKNFDITTSDVVFTDAKDGGDIATDLYKALVFAESKGLIDEDTRWDEGVTKAEAIELLFDTMYKSIMGEIKQASNNSNHTKTNDKLQALLDEGEGEWVDTPDYGYESEEEYLADDADGILGGTVVTTETGESYIIWDSTGDIYYPGDNLPDGCLYLGNEVDMKKMSEKLAEMLND